MELAVGTEGRGGSWLPAGRGVLVAPCGCCGATASLGGARGRRAPPDHCLASCADASPAAVPSGPTPSPGPRPIARALEGDTRPASGGIDDAPAPRGADWRSKLTSDAFLGMPSPPASMGQPAARDQVARGACGGRAGDRRHGRPAVTGIAGTMIARLGPRKPAPASEAEAGAQVSFTYGITAAFT